MLRPLAVLSLAALLSACITEELRSPVVGSPAFMSTAPEVRSRVTEIASKPSFELEAPPLGEVGNLCTYRTRKEPVMQGFVDRSGAGWEGEIRLRDLPSLDPKWFSPQDKRIATMIARPRLDAYRVRIDDNCYNAETKKYYSCSKVLEADLSQVRGFARAVSLERARGLAIQLCEKKVLELVEKVAAPRQENMDLRCHVFEQAYCELPPAPPPPPDPKKKKK
jgi:hypothetical protein